MRDRLALTHRKESAASVKFNDELVEKLCALIANGFPIYVAVAQAGITRESFYSWYKESEKGDPYYNGFHEKINKARAQAQTAAIMAFRSGLVDQEIVESVDETITSTKMVKGKPVEQTRKVQRVKKTKVPRDWRAGEAWLKRTDPENWGGVDIAVIGTEDTPIRFVDYREKLALMGGSDEESEPEVVEASVTVIEEGKTG